MKKIYQGLFLTLLLFISSASWAQNKTISGRVIGEKGEGVSNASVAVKGTKIGVVANEKGEFKLSVPATAKTLVITSLGFAILEEPINGRSSIEVKLNPSAKELSDVVVTALGIRREEKALGYSVQKVSGELLQKVSGVDVATSLSGKVAGLLVKNSSDFASVPDVTIRGEKPLLVIDGIAYVNKSLTDMSSEDIESISVLKGATASALYGFRGANGAIMITTKNGATGKTGITVDYATNTMFSAGYLAIPSKQGLYGRGSNNTYDKNSDNSWGTTMTGQIVTQWDPKTMAYRDYEYLPRGVKNFQNFLEQGYITNNNFNVGYKGDVLALRTSVNWTENKGRYPNSTLDKYTYSFGGDVNLGKFKMSSNLSYAVKKSPNVGSNSYTAYDPMYSLLIWSGVDFDIRDYKDNYWLVPGQTQNYTYRSGSNNPYYDRYQRTNQVSRNIFNADLSMSYEFSKYLKASIRSGLDFYTDKGELRTAWGSYVYTGNTGVPGNGSTWNGYMTGNYNVGQTQGNSINTDLLLTGSAPVISKLKVDYLLGGTIFYRRDDNINASTNGGLSVPGFYSLKASVSPAQVAQSSAQQQVNSVFGRLGASYGNFAFIEATGRNDWSSTLPSATRSYFYPSVSSSFLVSEFLPSTKNWLDLMKVRGSWTVSKEVPSIYGSTANSVFGINSGTWNTLNGATAPGSLYRTDIKPSSATTVEVGLQQVMFKNRLTVDISYYSKHFKDGILSGPLSGASGYNSAYINTKEQVSRRGWELMVNSLVVKNKDWKWNVGVNLSKYASYYTALDPTYSAKKPWVKVGERADAFSSREFLADPATGKLIFNNGRLQVAQYDSKFGNKDPDFVWGINSSVSYKAFSLYISMDGVSGGLMNTRTESYMWQSGVHPDGLTPERALDVATPGSKNFVGQGLKLVSGSVTFDPYGNITSDTRTFAPNDIATTYKQYINDLHGSSAWGGNGTRPDTYSKTYLKLREISLTYTVPTKMLHGIAKGASVSFVGQNVLLKAKDFKYSDPDGGIEDFADPSVRWLGFNLKFTF
ncbi:MAG: SusC/RagA family TonB-linked outer membrane protein [Chitinophagaceae bacterium]|nr:SusC/RagA family TonB-linked outer membrane protein [Chitinophagaceae bacterium]